MNALPVGLASRLLAPNLLSWKSALAVLPQALGRVLSRLFYAFPRIREVWNSCPGSGQPAAAMKTHLAKYIGLIEEERAIAFLTRRMATAAWKDRSDISFLILLHALPHKTVAPTVRQAVLKWAFDEESDTWFLIRRHWTRQSVCACVCVHLDSATTLLRQSALGCNVPVSYVAMVITVFNEGPSTKVPSNALRDGELCR